MRLSDEPDQDLLFVLDPRAEFLSQYVPPSSVMCIHPFKLTS